ncbi:hypothetical protein BJX64DRAFT_287151 [Aspergillus heterothallicus]
MGTTKFPLVVMSAIQSCGNGALPAADIARILDTAGIPHILFGWWAAGCHGTDRSPPEIDFIIPDSKMNASINAIAATSHFQHCTNRDCVEWTGDRCVTRVPRPRERAPLSVYADLMAYNNIFAVAREHFHIGPGYDYFSIVSLYAQSRLKIPTHAALIEALFILHCRDLGATTGRNHPLDGVWNQMFNTALGEKFLDDDLNLNESMIALRRDINPRWLPALDPYLFEGTSEPLPSALNRMRTVLLQNNELRDIPPHDLT